MGDLSLPSLDVQFVDEEERLKTFQEYHWPNTAPVPYKDLARAGFIYTGCGLEVECFQCHVKCSDWTYGEIAIKKHKELNKDCPFVKELSGILIDQCRLSSGTYRTFNNGASVVINYGSQSIEKRNMTRVEYESIWKDRHVLLIRESERLKTYEGWPLNFIRPEDLARAGFVYLKTEDRVQCVFCKGIVSQWEREDVPLQEHSRHFPRCPFIKGVDKKNISIEDELRSQLRENQPSLSRGIDVCGKHPMDMRTFKPERVLSNSSSYEDLNIIQHTAPKYQAFSTRESRIKSFSESSWPVAVPQDVNALVDAGFFYTGTGDSVTCFHCGGGLKNWEQGDIPFEEHARWFPKCSYVVLNKGKDYIQKAKLHKPPILEEQVPRCSYSPSGISDSELDVLMESDVAKEVLEMGIDRHKVREALRQRWIKVNYNFATANDLASAALELRDVGSPVQVSEPVDVTNPVVLNGNVQFNNSRGGFQVGPAISGSVTGHESEKASGMLKRKSGDLNAEQEFRLCKLCMDKEMSVVFLPCGHFVACTSCAPSLTTCPVCRADIKGSVRTFLP